MSSQWLVASRPSSTPAAPSSSEPVHTDVVQVDVSCAVRIQSTSASSSTAVVGAGSAGHHQHLRLGQVGQRGVGAHA